MYSYSHVAAAPADTEGKGNSDRTLRNIHVTCLCKTFDLYLLCYWKLICGIT